MDNNNWLDVAIPTGWTDVIVTTVKVFLIAFVIYHVKEFIDAGRFDTAELAVDALWVAGAALIVESVLMIWRNPKT